jgi:uncharacterized protein (TIGR02246 family)
MSIVDDSSIGRDALRAVEAGWNAASADWDADALANVYTHDALFFGGRPGHAVGRDAIREYFASYRGVVLSGTMELADAHFLGLGASGFLVQGYADFAFVLTGREKTQSVLRATLLVVPDEGDWRIRQHHFSATPATPPLRGPAL